MISLRITCSRKSLNRTPAACIPDADWTVNRHTPDLVPKLLACLGSDIVQGAFDTPSAVHPRSALRPTPDGVSIRTARHQISWISAGALLAQFRTCQPSHDFACVTHDLSHRKLDTSGPSKKCRTDHSALTICRQQVRIPCTCCKASPFHAQS